MIDFLEVVKNFKRMCDFYKTQTRNGVCPNNCPMPCSNISQCRKMIFEEPKRSMLIITDWAEDHPEERYPTINEILNPLGFIIDKNGFGTRTYIDKDTFYTSNHYNADEPIPEEIAKIFGIKKKIY